jgi:hypothetical protein
VAAATVAAVLAAPALGPGVVCLIGLVAAVASLGVGTLGSRSLGSRSIGVAVLLSGAAIALSTVPAWTADWTQRWILWTFGAGCTIVALGSLTRNWRAGAFGGVTVLVLLAGWSGMLASGWPAERAAAIMAIASIGAVGLLPRVAMTASGLTRLDDHSSEDEPVSRASVAAAVDSAHRGLAVACLAVAASAALAGLLLAAAATVWTLLLAGLVGVTLLLRMRAFPLTLEVVALVAAGLVIGAGLLVVWARATPGVWWGPAAVAVGMSALALVVLAYQPPPHVRALARQYADRLEAGAVMALVPVALGVFQVYPRLLDTF